MHHVARLDVTGGEADGHAVLKDRLALTNGAGRQLVAGWHLGATSHAFAGQEGTDAHFLAGNHHVVVGMQENDGASDTLFGGLD